jgi:outer membrane protein OmpA-like peptidoglycan-associated protein
VDRELRLSRGELAVQLLGAGAGIAAWIALVGGARLWARMEALGVPAAQTVSSLPRELLIAEGFRTLLVPLLLGAAIAGIVYLSRVRAGARDGGGRSDEPDDGGPGPGGAGAPLERAREAVGAAGAAARAARRELDQAERLASSRGAQFDLTEARAAEARARWALDVLTMRLRAAAAAVEEARRADGRDRPAQPLADAYRELDRAAADLDEDRPKLAATAQLRREPDSDELRAARAELTSLAETVERARAAAGRAAEALAAPVPATRAGRRRRALRELPPVRQAARQLRSLRRFWGSAGVATVIAVVAGFEAIALAIVRAEWWSVVVTGVVLLVLAALAARWGLRGVAVVLLGLCVPLPALVGLASVLEWRYVAYAALLSLLTIWLTLGAMSRWQGARALAWILFVSIAFWSGGLAFIREAGLRTGERELDVAIAKRTSSTETIQGYYLGRTAKHVYLLRAPIEICDEDDLCGQILVMRDEDLQCLVFAGPRDIETGDQSVDLRPGLQTIEFATPDSKDDPCPGGTPGGPGSSSTPGGAEVQEREHQEPEEQEPEEQEAEEQEPEEQEPEEQEAERQEPEEQEPERQEPEEQEPERQEPEAPSRTIVMTDRTLFDYAEATLTPEARRVLDDIARRIHGRRADVVIDGHTDSRGSRAYNRRLSCRRALAVRRALLERLRADAAAVVARGVGEDRPVAPNVRRDGADDREGRRRNRRVVIRINRSPPYSAPRCRPARGRG